jgi:hypothetical protein
MVVRPASSRYMKSYLAGKITCGRARSSSAIVALSYGYV